MITSYEVGSVFKIVDQASPVLKRLAVQFGELDALIVKTHKNLSSFSSARFTGLGTRLKGINEQMAALGVNSGKAFGGVDVAIQSSIARVQALRAEVGLLGAEMRGLGRIGVAGGGGGGGRHTRPGQSGGGSGGGPHFGQMSVPLPGKSHLHLGGNAALAGAGLIGYGVYEEAQMEDAIFQLLYHTGMNGTKENKGLFRNILQKAMSETGYGLNDVAEAAKTETRMFKGVPGGGLDVLPEMLRAAAIESRLKGSSLQESMNSLIGLAHMTKEYSPEDIKKLAPAFAFLSASNPSSLGSMEKAASYAVPILQSGLEIDPLQSLLLGTVMTRAGATNTKSGTWLRNMVVGSMPGSTIVGDPKKHHEALAALGLIDGDNKPTWFDSNGKPNVLKMLDVAGEHAANIPLTERAAIEKQAFGVQGAGAFALLADPAVKAQIKALRKEMESEEFNNRYSGFMKEYSEGSPVQKFRETWQDLKNVLMDIGNIVIPPLVVGLKGLDEVLKIIKVTVDFNWEILKSGFGIVVNGIKALGDAFDWFKNKIGGLFGASPTSYDGGGGGFGGGIINAAYHPGGANDNGGAFPAVAGGGSGNFGGVVGSAQSVLGAASGSATLQRYLATGGVGMDSRTTAWCAAFVNASLAHAGIQGTGSLAAGSFANWGSAVHGSIMAGDIIGHGKGWHGHRWGHAMIATGRAHGGLVEVIEGNSSHRVKRDWVNPNSEQFIRRGQHVAPYSKPPGGGHQNLTVMLDGEVIHRSVVNHERRATEHSHQAPTFDGHHDFSAPDGQIWAA